MTMELVLSSILGSLAFQLPQIVVAVAGLVLIQSRLKHVHSRAYRYGKVGFTLLLVNGLWGVLLRTYVATHSATSSDRLSASSKIVVANLIGFAFLAASLAFILAAVVADREPSRTARDAA